MTGKVVLISGACGTGKSTVSRFLAENSPCGFSVHMHTDDFYQYIRKGYTDPWLDESGDQNETVVEVAAASAARFAAGGYEVYVDGVIGPWFLKPWLNLAQKFDVRYIVLRPDEQCTIQRAAEREQRAEFPLDSGAVQKMWQMFTNLGEYEANTIDTTGQAIEESVDFIQKRLREGDFSIGASKKLA